MSVIRSMLFLAGLFVMTGAFYYASTLMPGRSLIGCIWSVAVLWGCVSFGMFLLIAPVAMRRQRRGAAEVAKHLRQSAQKVSEEHE